MYEFNEQYLKDRISPYSNQWLLIFFNRPLMNWYKRYLKYRDDIIYITHNEMVNGGLVGLRYYNYKFIDQAYTKEDLEKSYQLLKEQEIISNMKKLYELPQNTKLYIEDKVIIFDHIDGFYSYCWLEEDKNKIVHIKATATFKKYKDGYKYVEESK